MNISSVSAASPIEDPSLADPIPEGKGAYASRSGDLPGESSQPCPSKGIARGGCYGPAPSKPDDLSDLIGPVNPEFLASLDEAEQQRTDRSHITGPVTPADRAAAEIEIIQRRIEQLSADAQAAGSDGVISDEERETLLMDVARVVARVNGGDLWGGVAGPLDLTASEWLRELVRPPLPQPQVPSMEQQPVTAPAGQAPVGEGQGIWVYDGGCIPQWRDLPAPAEPGAPSDRVGTWDKSDTGGSRDKGPVTKADKAAAEVLQSSTGGLIADAQAAASDGVISEKERETLMRDVVKVVAHLKGYGPDVDFIDQSDRTPEDWLRMFTSPPPVCYVPPPSERDDLASKIGDFLRAVPAEDPGTVAIPPPGQRPGPGDVIYDGGEWWKLPRYEPPSERENLRDKLGEMFDKFRNPEPPLMEQPIWIVGTPVPEAEKPIWIEGSPVPKPMPL